MENEQLKVNIITTVYEYATSEGRSSLTGSFATDDILLQHKILTPQIQERLWVIKQTLNLGKAYSLFH